jgi:hypothetical protein
MTSKENPCYMVRRQTVLKSIKEISPLENKSESKTLARPSKKEGL